MAASNCLSKIRSSYGILSEKEKKIADFILEDPQNIIHSSINEVADHLEVADATVFRFCKRLGFKGFQALKIALASDIVGPLQDIHETILESDTPAQIAEKVFQSNIGTLEDTRQMLDEKSFQAAVDSLLAARKIEFYGNGGSGIIAMDAHHKFIRTGKPSIAYTDTHFQLMSASQLTEWDVALFISHSGTNKDLLHVMRVAKDNGCRTISLTDYAKSPLSEKADISLHTISRETEFRSEALSSRIAQLSIIDALYVNVMMAGKEAAQKSLQRMRSAISEKKF
ncbi:MULTISPECIES: MurR/RpiR family transcriptional regulator [Fictibacillus]|uniref:MurR/RpiR family transcriptional regulator n=1 Tax=Fictibacillus terranigra TaxID=3058424 RepID=A0ABT8E0Z9_9BACL|nr:MurR/RpiR family transcriptional regulator [Fictibacillus sp. CENA-BCM004]MDN4071580.1 MurR/RpiR family transcriptional regulator [Fictibacillus sp. CENA-BCM004]